MAKGILGKKIGMTQIFSEDGLLIPVTVIEVTPNVVLQKKVVATDGYNAIQLGYDDKKEKVATKPEIGHAKAANTAPKRFVKEIAGEEMLAFEVGQLVKANIFVEGEMVDVTGTSKGKGYGVDRANKELMNIVSQSQEYSADKTPEQTRIAPQVNPNLVKMAMSQQFKR